MINKIKEIKEKYSHLLYKELTLVCVSDGITTFTEEFVSEDYKCYLFQVNVIADDVLVDGMTLLDILESNRIEYLSANTFDIDIDDIYNEFKLFNISLN